MTRRVIHTGVGGPGYLYTRIIDTLRNRFLVYSEISYIIK